MQPPAGLRCAPRLLPRKHKRGASRACALRFVAGGLALRARVRAAAEQSHHGVGCAAEPGHSPLAGIEMMCGRETEPANGLCHADATLCATWRLDSSGAGRHPAYPPRALAARLRMFLRLACAAVPALLCGMLGRARGRDRLRRRPGQTNELAKGGVTQSKKRTSPGGESDGVPSGELRDVRQPTSNSSVPRWARLVKRPDSRCNLGPSGRTSGA